jgi:methylated-DNA-protein-cysteine methyltransferase-like protein
MKRRPLTSKHASPSGSDPDARRQRILATVDSIPRGSVATYGLVALEAGLPRRARLVGKVLSTLPARTPLPWWRVVSASGAIALRGDGSAPAEQRGRLAAEGVSFRPSGRVDLARHLWRP